MRRLFPLLAIIILSMGVARPDADAPPSDPKEKAMGEVYARALRVRDWSPVESCKAAIMMRAISDSAYGGSFAERAKSAVPPTIPKMPPAKDVPISAHKTLRGVRFGVSLAKSVFVDGEPIVAILTLTNTSKKEIVLGELAYWTGGSGLVRKSGAEMPGGIEFLMPGMPKDFGRVFRPGESQTAYHDLTWQYGRSLPLEPYILKSVYRCEDPDTVGNTRIEWKGKITLPDLVLQIVSPRNDMEQAAYELFVDSIYLWDEPSPYKRAAILHALSDPAWGGVFALEAGYMEVEALKKTGDKAASLKTLQEYAEKHKAEPYYYQKAISSLGSELYNDGKYAEARAVYEKLPDGYNRQQALKRCDTHLAK